MLRTLTVRRMLFWLIVGLVVIWTVYPFYWAALSSVRPGGATFGGQHLPFVQFEPTLRGWESLFERSDLPRAMLNSMLISIGAASIATTLGALGAYGLARFPFPNRWKSSFLLLLVLIKLMPTAVLVTPYLLLSLELGLRDTVLGLVIANGALNLPLAMFVLFTSFAEIPAQLDQVAMVDGASSYRRFRDVAIPLAKPALAGAWLLCFAFAWNEAMLSTALSFTEARSMPVLLVATGGGGGANFTAVGTRSLITMLVPVLVALAAQRYMVRGLSMGAVKG